ncbi:MAG TPA: hypothetical protein VN905_01755 [Candidatus Binatia bacterium]|nr:hypothetical protein [Candidatus Binatia bacterium]
MSTYFVNAICNRTVHDQAFRAAMKADPEEAISEYDLTAAERKALLGGQVGTLAKMGAHTFLLGHLTRYGLVGLNDELYGERMRAILADS